MKFWAVESDLRGRMSASAALGALLLVSMRSYAAVSEKAFWFPALDCRRGRLRHARRVAAVIVAGAVTALAGTACTAATSGTGAGGHGPPPVTVLMQAAGNGNGDIFIAPQGGGGYASGPEILTPTGKVIWFHALPAGEMATDFRTQAYQGRPVLTWFQGEGLSGTDYIYNDRYQQIAEVRAGHGYLTDFHEFLITPWNTALILADTLASIHRVNRDPCGRVDAKGAL